MHQPVMEYINTNSSEVVESVCEIREHSANRVIRATYIGVDLVLTMFGNLLTIVVTRKVEEFSDSTKMMFTSLALADLGVASVVVTSFAAEISGGWIFPTWVCYASFLCFYIFTAVSEYMLIMMTFDRLVAVTRPLRYSLILTKGRSLVAVVVVWLTCTAGAIFTTFTNQITYNECSALCLTTDRNIIQSVVAIVAFYFIPLTLIILMNLKLLAVAHQHARRFRNQVAPTPTVSIGLELAQAPHPPRGALRGKAVGVVSLVTFAFIVSWSLYNVKLITNAAYGGGVAFSEWIEFSSIWLALTNSWWNVIIYSVMNRSFRQHLKYVLRRLCSWLPEQLRDICRR